MGIIYQETDLVIPKGKKAGCKVRLAVPGAIHPRIENEINIFPQNEWEEMIRPEITLTPFIKNIFDQNGVGSCTTEASTQGTQLIRAYENQPFVKLAPWSVYPFVNGGVDRGSNVDAVLRRIKDHGILPISVWPRSRGWNTKAPEGLWERFGQHFRMSEVFDITRVVEIGSALLQQFCVVFGWKGHCCVMTELLDRDHARYANSWTETWNGNGMGIINLSSVNFGYGAWAYRSCVHCPPEVYQAITDYANTV